MLSVIKVSVVAPRHAPLGMQKFKGFFIKFFSFKFIFEIKSLFLTGQINSCILVLHALFLLDYINLIYFKFPTRFIQTIEKVNYFWHCMVGTCPPLACEAKIEKKANGHIHNTSFSSQLTNGSNKLECLSLESLSSLV
jgi:hypothetical protein